MLDISYYTDYLEKWGVTRFGNILYSICAGALGAVILVVFFNGIMQATTLDKLLPFIVGFNAALTGYMVIEKTRMETARKKWFTMGSGAVMALLTFAGLNFLFFQWAGYLFFNVDSLIIMLLVGIVFGGLGGGLCTKYLKLNRLNA